MYPAKNISMVVGRRGRDDEETDMPNERPTLFKVIVELANLGYQLKLEEDMGGNTLTASWRVTPHPGLKVATQFMVENHFHVGYPDCSATEAEAQLIMNLQKVIQQIKRSGDA